MSDFRHINKLCVTSIIISILAMLDTAYLAFLHFIPSGSSFCDLAPNISCSIVNKSIYSEIFGIPVSMLGFLTFLIILILNVIIMKNKKISFINRKSSALIISLMMGFSVLFGSWLIYVQDVLLLTWCILCLFLDALIFATFIISIIQYKRVNRR